MKHSFRSSRRQLLKFLSGAAVGSTVVGAEKIPETVSGIVLAKPEDVGEYLPDRSDWMQSEPLPYAHPGLGTHLYEVVPWVLYERLEWGAGEQTPRDVPLLMNPIGSNRGYHWTNMLRHGQLPPPQQFRVDVIRWLVAPGARIADCDRFVSGYEDQFWIGQKVYAGGPVTLSATIARLRQVAVTVDDVSDWRNAYPEIGRKIRLLRPVPASTDFRKTGGLVIPMEMAFHGELHGEPFVPEGDLTMWFCLEGSLARGVQ